LNALPVFIAAQQALPPTLTFESVPNPLKLPPDMNFGEVGIYGKSGKNPGEFGWAHALACPSENEVYVGELLNWRVQSWSPKEAPVQAGRCLSESDFSCRTFAASWLEVS
jgi:hypothetical protein